MSEPTELYRRWLSAWSDREQPLEPLIAADAVGHWPGQDVVGPAGFATAIAQMLDVFDSVELELEVGPIVAGDLLAARWVGRLQTGDELMVFAGHDILRIEDGRIAEYWPATVPLGGA